MSLINVGAIAPAGSVTFVRTISFSIYQKAKYKYSDAIGQATGSDEPLVVASLQQWHVWTRLIILLQRANPSEDAY